MIQLRDGGKFEIQRRVVADNLAKGRFYILADLGCVPDDAPNPDFMEPVDGIVGFSPGVGGVPTGARIIQKGAVTRWPQKSTPSYDKEHVVAMELAGKRVRVCPSISCKQILDC